MATSAPEHATDSKEAETASRANGHVHRTPRAVIESGRESVPQGFGGSPFPYTAGATRLLAGAGLANSANNSVRAIALKRTQQAQGNRFAQQIIRQAQSSPTASPIVQRRGVSEGKAALGTTAAIAGATAYAREGYFTRGNYGTALSDERESPEVARAKRLDQAVIGDLSDPMEHEADRVAEAATQSSLNLSSRDLGISAEPHLNQIRRACAACGDGECSCADRPRTQGAPAEAPPLLEPQSPGSGSPLSDKVREKVEPILGADLSQVRVHNDPASHEAAADLQARAFTHGNRIWLGANESPEDVSLLAHEATHVVQQTGDKATRRPEIFQRQGWAHVQHPDQPAYPRPPDPYPTGMQCDQRALAAMHTETVELKGTPDFRPSYWLAEGLSCAYPEPVWVRVRFGTLASGAIRVRMLPPPATISAPGTKIRGPYETTDPEAFIPLTHPAFPASGTLASPKLFINIRNSEVTGNVGFFTGLAKLAYVLLPRWQRVFTLERLLGWRGLTDVQPESVVNELRGGVLRYALQNFAFGLQDLQGLAGVASENPDYTGTGNFSVVDEATSFSAETLIQAPGVTEARMPLHRAQGRIFGSASMSVTLAPRDVFGGTFSGSLQGTYANGVMAISGNARYRSQKLNGSVTMLIAPRALAWTEVIRQLPTGAPPITAGAAMAPGHVVVGWGTLDFHINEWLIGHASVVVDPDGYITSHGVLRPARQFEFLNEPGRYEVNRPVGPHLGPLTVTFATIGIASLNGSIEADLRAGGKIGPARLYGLEVEGQFSSRPGTVFTGRITGRANLSAQASVAASLTGSLSGSIGTPPADVRVVTVALNIIGQATLRAYVELQPTFDRIAGPTPDEAQYRISGTLTAGGAVSLGLKGSVKFSIAGVGPRINLGKVQYPLGSIGLKATFSHILGSRDPIETDVTAADFNEAQYSGFIQDLFEETAPEDEGEHEKKLEQTAGKPPERTPHPTVLRTTFTMSGTPHTLWLEPPGPLLRMASNGEDSLDAKLRNEIAIVDQQRRQQQGEEAEMLTAEAQSAHSLLARSVSVERSLGELESEAESNPDVAGFNEIASGLTAYGEEFGKSDLAQAPPTPQPGEAPEVKTDDKGRYVIEDRAQLEAVRNARPVRPPDMDPSLESMWREYLSYFDDKIRLIDRDLTPPKRTVRHEPPLTWPAYIEARGFYEQLGKKKEFQTELRDAIYKERGDLDLQNMEIDVGLKKGRSETGYADLVITDPQNNLEVYSVKVRNVTAQTTKLADDDAVRRWIRENLKKDVEDAIDSYGGRVQFRREFRSKSTGRAGGRSEGPHPLFGQKVFVNRVILVWKGSSDLVPERFREYILSTGNELGATYRSTISCEVRLQP